VSSDQPGVSDAPPATPAAPILKIATFNAENFYMLLDHAYTPAELSALDHADYLAMNKSIYNPNKDLAKIAAIGQTILDEGFDFVGLCEVGGLETLRNFNHYFLDDRYDCYLHQQNSSRGIFVGALLKKGRFYDVKARNMKGDFSRNLLGINLTFAGIKLDFFVVHLKSHYGRDAGLQKRVQEVQALCSLVRLTNCVVLGDFNGILVRGDQQFEFEPFLALPFRDVLEAMGVPASARFSHYHFGETASFNQLDYIFCTEDIAILDGGMMVGDIPATFRERRLLPSDHIFLKAVIRPFARR